MNVEEAVQFVTSRFPFPGYMDPQIGLRGAYSNIANTVVRYLQPEARILDFGCGPCDKTAILQRLGFQCAGYDDLRDEWHSKPGHREKILSFAAELGIDFRLAQAGPLPFAKGSFDLVMLHDVLEHLHDSPRDLLNDLLELAKPRGFLFVTVPNAANIRKRIGLLREIPTFQPMRTTIGDLVAGAATFANTSKMISTNSPTILIWRYWNCEAATICWPGYASPCVPPTFSRPGYSTAGKIPGRSWPGKKQVGRRAEPCPRPSANAS